MAKSRALNRNKLRTVCKLEEAFFYRFPNEIQSFIVTTNTFWSVVIFSGIILHLSGIQAQHFKMTFSPSRHVPLGSTTFTVEQRATP